MYIDLYSDFIVLFLIRFCSKMIRKGSKCKYNGWKLLRFLDRFWDKCVLVWKTTKIMKTSTGRKTDLFWKLKNIKKTRFVTTRIFTV